MTDICCLPTTDIGIRFSDTGREKLTDDLNQVLTWMDAFTAANRLPPPILISTCRTKQQQTEMQNRWDAGERSGLAARPADASDSLHVAELFQQCRAFDLGNTQEWLDIVGPQTIKAFPMVEWGGNFMLVDKPHFEWPGGRIFLFDI
jgi:hypothetical protein